MAFGPWSLSILYAKIRKKKKEKNSEPRYLLVYRMRNLKFGKNFAGDGKISASIGN